MAGDEFVSSFFCEEEGIKAMMKVREENEVRSFM